MSSFFSISKLFLDMIAISTEKVLVWPQQNLQLFPTETTRRWTRVKGQQSSEATSYFRFVRNSLLNVEYLVSKNK